MREGRKMKDYISHELELVIFSDCDTFVVSDSSTEIIETEIMGVGSSDM